MSPVRLQGDGVEKRFGRIVALRGIDFTIEPGESISILGANGAGKSTLLRILAGLSRPSAGQLKAQTIGADTELSRDGLRGAVGYVGHQTLVYGELSARENLDFAARLHGRTPSREQIDRVLEGVALLDVADRRAGTFSRGMAQRLSIARAIVHEPTILLLDEPFTGLDETSAGRLSNQLATLREGGRSIVLVTHDPRRAVELSDRALILHRGEIRATPSRATASRAIPSRTTQSPSTPSPDTESGDAFELAALRETLTRIASDSPNGSAA